MMQTIAIALQLYSIREECEKDLPTALAAVAEMGYAGVEFGGYYGWAPKDIRHMLDDLGLKAVGIHTWFHRVPLVGPGSEPHVVAAAEMCHALGTDIMIGVGDIPFPKEQQALRSGWIERADLFNQLAERLARDGIRVGYHNHALEFETVIEGETAWDILFGQLSDRVTMQLDIGSCAQGGGDPLAVLKRYPGRARTVHLKPYSYAQGTRPVIGEDDLPWPQILEACETVGGTEWYIVEYESDGYPRLEAVRRCREALRAMGR